MKKFLGVVFIIFMVFQTVCFAENEKIAMAGISSYNTSRTPAVNPSRINTRLPYSNFDVPPYYRRVYYNRPVVYYSTYGYPYYNYSDDIICINKRTDEVVNCSTVKSNKKGDFICVKKSTNQKIDCPN